jgi:hypothetical protein
MFRCKRGFVTWGEEKVSGTTGDFRRRREGEGPRVISGGEKETRSYGWFIK